MNPEDKPKSFPTAIIVTALGAALLAGLASCALFYLNRQTIVPAGWGTAGGTRAGVSSWFDTVQNGLLLPLLTGVFGALILRRRAVPHIGALFLVFSPLSAAVNLATEFAVFGIYTRAAPLPGAQLAAWVDNWLWIFAFVVVLYALALFPNGHFLSRRWRYLVRVTLFLFAASFFLATAMETPLSSAFQIANPFFDSYPVRWHQVLFNLGLGSLLLSITLVLLTVLLRFRQSQGRERHQLKWLLSGTALLAVLVAGGYLVTFGLGSPVGGILFNSALLGPLLGIGVALVRHRLYDIDIIIQRTLLYGGMSAILALVYYGSVMLLQAAVSSAVAGRSPLIIVLSTLMSPPRSSRRCAGACRC